MTMDSGAFLYVSSNNKYDLPLRRTPVITFIIPL